MRGDKENVNLHRQLVLFIYYDIIHEVQSNIKRNEFKKKTSSLLPLTHQFNGPVRAVGLLCVHACLSDV